MQMEKEEWTKCDPFIAFPISTKLPLHNTTKNDTWPQIDKDIHDKSIFIGFFKEKQNFHTSTEFILSL